MRHLIALTFAAGLAVASGPALADNASGTIESWDATTNCITLTDGNVYCLGPDVRTEGLIAGTDINIVYETVGGVNQASEITVRQ
jgi:hypothetical protein